VLKFFSFIDLAARFAHRKFRTNLARDADDYGRAEVGSIKEKRIMESTGTAFDSRSVQPRHIAGENSATIMQPDILAAVQYADDRRAQTLEPERALMLAILEDAVCCFQQHHLARCGNSKRVFEEAQRWFFKASDDWVFSFENICAVLGLDPQYIRGGLARWKGREASKHRGGTQNDPALRSGTHG
jgi:hypothetical protein